MSVINVVWVCWYCVFEPYSCVLKISGIGLCWSHLPTYNNYILDLGKDSGMPAWRIIGPTCHNIGAVFSACGDQQVLGGMMMGIAVAVNVYPLLLAT